DVRRGLPGDDGDEQARYIEGVITGPDGGIVRVASIYLPNGNPVGTEKYTYKLAWMERLRSHAAYLMAHEEPLFLCGDYNVIPDARDARFPEAWTGDALYLPETRAAFRRLLALGFTDALRATADADGLYTFWDYQAGAWQKNNGIRIDHILMSPQGADRLRAARIDAHVRGWEKPSDHVPMIAHIN
ncbi:MAG: exodeoxyribonuclease III, partial [Beijerinckiaceae bacterium]